MMHISIMVQLSCCQDCWTSSRLFDTLDSFSRVRSKREIIELRFWLRANRETFRSPLPKGELEITYKGNHGDQHAGRITSTETSYCTTEVMLNSVNSHSLVDKGTRSRSALQASIFQQSWVKTHGFVNQVKDVPSPSTQNSLWSCNNCRMWLNLILSLTRMVLCLELQWKFYSQGRASWL